MCPHLAQRVGDRTMSTTTDNERVYRRVVEEVWTNRNFDAIDDFVAEDCVYHDTTHPEPSEGSEGMREFAETLATVLDGEPRIDQVLTAGDWVVARFTASGEHAGEVLGIQPTHEDVSVSGIEMVRFEAGKIVEGYQIIDSLGFLEQIGVRPEDLSEVTVPADN